MNKYRTDLDPHAANSVPLSPVSLVHRSAISIPMRAIVFDAAAGF